MLRDDGGEGRNYCLVPLVIITSMYHLLKGLHEHLTRYPLYRILSTGKLIEP